MEAILLAERHTIARALPRLAFFAIILTLTYVCQIAAKFGYTTEFLEFPSALIAFLAASLIMNTAFHVLDQVRYADKYRLENAQGHRLCR